MATHTAMAQGNDAGLRSSLEKRLGILHFVSPKERAWHGQLRTRFSDFLVYEIGKDGEVVHLNDFHTSPQEYGRTDTSRQAVQKPAIVQAPKTPMTEAGVKLESTTIPEIKDAGKLEQPKSENTPEMAIPSDKSALIDLLGQETTDELVAFYTKIKQDPRAKPKSFGDVSIPAVTDRAKRSKIHTEVRRFFEGKIDTSTESDGTIKADTGDAVNQIARVLNLKPNLFNTAGTKDRRAVTVQRVSMRSRNPQSMVFINKDRIPGVKIGDFKFEEKALYLGSHQGNEFVIILKNCWFNGTEDLPFDQRLEFAKSTVEPALAQLTQQGFINYFGTQRFGTFEIGTQEIGMKILKGDFEGAVGDLLSFDPALLQLSGTDQNMPFRRDDVSRAKACSTFLETGSFQAALKTLPRRCNVEFTVMRHLEKSPNDFLGALQSISRGMRTMYVHAYQSLVWNFAASTRWGRYGNRAVKGDLILAKSEAYADRGDEQVASVNEEIIHLAEGDATDTDMTRLQVHVLTEEEANSGDYNIFDVVLPTPGWDMIYPNNEIGEFYTEFMGKEENGGLNPNDMRRPQKDFSLPGSYRKLMGKLTRTPSVSVRGYLDDTEQLVPTDLDDIKSRKAKDAELLKTKSSGWHTFVKDVRENEKNKAKAETERRKAEDPIDIPEVRLNDTWVQTSLDGSNKRFKVARHSPEKDTAASSGNEDTQVDSKYPADRSVTMVNSTDDNTIVASITGLENADKPTMDISSKPVDADTEQDAAKTADSTAATDSELTNDESKRIAPISRFTAQLPQRDDSLPDSGEAHENPTELAASTRTDTGEASSKQTPLLSTPDATDKKIAVILRFALDTSQYATMVLRELQGAPSETGTGTT
ncbi:putative trna pseudouridine synthase d protein [Eutypa lata UCREL1]|uniref:Putative trna pseudouridine synthase d protein n=1 Tax=Eutypa lata (strain UCR-EL1) TaxID=1287681 RepID=M7SX43_EUTLA|nr:putative trna pseudouridine synthase d protein [Eutypa lata UCREL1]